MESAHPPNRLVHETSPYLLQHAYNPVDWYPWGPEAFAQARERNLPIFLSVGYSACHWCHVMERECFEDAEIAKLMNAWFINIKVDREERPDIDQIYMSAVQLMTGQGGWPMSVFMDPTGAPFFGGTYWPPYSRQGMPGFAKILERLHDHWVQQRQDCLAKGQELVEAIDEMHHREQARSPLSEELLRNAELRLMRNFDPQAGGFGQAPKFPHPVDLRVLLRAWLRFGHADTLAAVTLTLNKMAAGGIYDHLGGGFARYATDRYWLVPHFEKMLYDNSQLVTVYLEGYQATGNSDYLRVARETLDYVLREMTSPEGGWYSTQDADSEGVEGKFYVWSAAEIDAVLDDDEARGFRHCYQVTPEGNWEGHNILHLARTVEENAADLQLEPGVLVTRLAEAKKKLLAVRSQRVWPGRDEKQIVAWNGLMLSAFARAARVLDEPVYRAQAERSADFLLREMRREDGTLWHCRKAGDNRINGFLDDYACLIEGLCDVYLASSRGRYLAAAVELAEVLTRRFYDAEGNRFHYTPDDHEDLVVRVRDLFDSAIPSGSNLAMSSLLRVGLLADRSDLLDLAERALEAVSGTMLQHPSGMGQALVSLDGWLGPVEEWVFFGGGDAEDNQRLRQALHRRFMPRQLVLTPEDRNDSGMQSPWIEGKTAVNGLPTLYRCRRGACEHPWIGAEEILRGLHSN